MQIIDLSDAVFLTRAQQGDQAAFTNLVERYHPMLIFVCRRYLGDYHRAEDAAQVAFTRAWVSIRNCQGEFRPWLLKIAKNYALDESRKAEYRRTVQFPQESDPADIPDTREPLDEALARQLDLFAAVKGLPTPYRDVIELRMEGAPFTDIAEQLGIFPCAARKRFERAIKLLRVALARDGHDNANERPAQCA